ncbi:MAG: glycosyltransferase [Dermatophilaceae bacterium]
MLETAPPPSAASAVGPAESATPPTASAPRVSAILVVRPDAPRLAQCLEALAASITPPDRLVVLDMDRSGDARRLVDDHEDLHEAIPHLRVLARDTPCAFGPAVNAVVEALAGEPGPDPDTAPEWLWLLPDDARVEPDTLARLLDAVRRSPSVGVAGPKVVQWDNPRRLVEAGRQLTRSGRRLTAPALGELDQGQYDARTDVLAVGTAGMLVRREAFERVGGFDPAFAQHGGDLDLGWRAQLAGYRVVVVPAARVLDAGATDADERNDGRERAVARRAQRRAARQVALTRCALLAAPLLAVWMVLAALGSALVLLVLKRPAHAWDELSDLGALAHPVRGIQARWRFRGKARLRRRDLDTLFVTSGQAARHTVDRVQDALTPERPARTTTTTAAADPDLVEPGPVAEEAEALTALPAALPQRIVTNPGFLAVLAATLVSVWGFRDSLRAGLLDAQGAGLAGGQLRGVSTDAAGLWHAFRDSWHGAGLGSGTDTGPHLAVLAALTWVAERFPYVQQGRSPAAVMMTVVLVLGMPLATLTAYLAGRVVTRATWPRAIVALGWGVSAVAVLAVTQGRVTAVLAHILLPLVAAGVARVASTSGTFTAAFATALGMGVLGALVPVLLALGALGALVLTVTGPGWSRRARGLVLLVVPLALQGPWLMHLGDPVTLLAAPGLLESADVAQPAPWLVALGQLDTAPTPLLFAAVPFVAAAVLALARPRSSRGEAVALAALGGLAVVGLVLGLGASRLVLGDAVDAVDADSTVRPVTAWPGVGVALLVLSVLSAALMGSVSRQSQPDGPRSRWRRLAAVTGLVVLGAAAVSGAALVGMRTLDATIGVGQDGLPAVAVDQARGPDSNRLLRLVRAGDRVDYELVGSEPGAFLRDIDRTAQGATTAPTDPGLAAVVAGLAAATPQGGASPGSRLADLGVGFVSAEVTGDDPLIRTLDASGGLTRLGTTDGQTLWRVLARPSVVSAAAAVPPARVRITAADGAAIASVPTVGPHGAVDHDVAAGPADRRVVFAEPAEWASRAQVSFDGIPLTPVAGQALPTYVLPEQAGHLSADVPPVYREWFIAQVAVVLFVVFMAIPFGNRRSRRPR